MFDNVRQLLAELENLGYRPERFPCSMRHSRGEGIQFDYRIADGSRKGETVRLGLVIPETVGPWPEGTPHWVHISPPDSVLEEQVQANRGSAAGQVRRYTDDSGIEWMAISAPVRDIWDRIDEADGKNAKTYIEEHIQRIWGAR